jgi:hypothetical protein
MNREQWIAKRTQYVELMGVMEDYFAATQDEIAGMHLGACREQTQVQAAATAQQTGRGPKAGKQKP